MKTLLEIELPAVEDPAIFAGTEPVFKAGRLIGISSDRSADLEGL